MDKTKCAFCCEDWLKQFMWGWEEPHILPVDFIRQAAMDGGFTRGELRTARTKLDMVSLGGVVDGRAVTFWWLPGEVFHP